jgi:crotonobetainyl-CoA:carnitine CoA-transferase CaiB-like acyl-CoA transferase
MSQPLPLADVCVIEIGHSLAAPYAGQIFAHLGARVIKIENSTTGDYARGWGPPFIEGAAALFHAMNNGKQSIRADFNDKAAATIPLKRIGHVEDTASAIEACATTMRFATGSRFVVDGGRSL